MRASYTAGVVVTLIEEGIGFSDVYGISAGCSHSANYISGDIWRARASFVEFFANRGVAGWGQFLRGNGYFNAEYIYEIACEPDEKLPFQFDAFMENPAQIHIEAFEPDTGRTVYWTKADMPTMLDLMKRARACSTMPVFMKPIEIDGQLCYDGGIGDSWGIPLAQAKRDGYKKFFIVRTQKRDYRKTEDKHPGFIKMLLGKNKAVADRMLERYKHYNAILDEIDELEARGEAYVFCPHTVLVKNTTLKQPLLEESFRLGYEQAQSELSAWRSFL